MNARLQMMSDPQLGRELERKTRELELVRLTKALRMERLELEKLRSADTSLRTGSEGVGRRMEMLEKENTYLELRLRMKEEELEDFQINRKPLEKAYR